jgi:hypothetical protein
MGSDRSTNGLLHHTFEPYGRQIDGAARRDMPLIPDLRRRPGGAQVLAVNRRADGRCPDIERQNPQRRHFMAEALHEENP